MIQNAEYCPAKILIITVLILTALTTISCSSTPAAHQTFEDPQISSLDLLNKVRIGMSREQVEILLSMPYSTSDQISADPAYKGIEVVALYSPKLRRLEQQIAEDMKANRNIETSRSILSTALSIIGNVIPSAALGTSIGSTALGTAGDLAAADISTTQLDPDQIESALIVYRQGSVHSIQRKNLSGLQR